MKKIAVLFLSVVLMAGLAACKEAGETVESAKPDEVIAADTDVSPEATDEPAPTEAESSGESLLSATYKVPMEDIYIDVPSYQEIEHGYTRLFIVHDSRYVAVTTQFNETAADAEEAHSDAFDKFIQNMTNYEGGVNSIDITTGETATVNGLEVYRFEGTINYGTTNIRDGYAVGYSFIMDDIPIEIIGSVIDEEQPTELIDEIDAIVEEMMYSVRAVK